jgi:anthranilate/para-aminobenzoate synthase component II
MILVVDNGIQGSTLQSALYTCSIPFHVYDATIDDLTCMALKRRITGVVLSGGPMKLSQPILFDAIAQNFRVLDQLPDVPVLGICFGCQVLHVLYGGKLRNLGAYICKDMDVKVTGKVKSPLLAGCAMEALRFCFSDLIVDKTDASSIVLACFKFRGKELPCAFSFSTKRRCKRHGVMFHPEYHEASHIVLKNFARMCLSKA